PTRCRSSRAVRRPGKVISPLRAQRGKTHMAETAQTAATQRQIDPLVALGEKLADIQHHENRRLILAQTVSDLRNEKAALEARVTDLEGELETLRPATKGGKA